MQHIQLANVACGWHAGSAEQMLLCAELAQKYGVQCGIHPGVKANKGRGDIEGFSVCEFYDHLEAQFLFFEKYLGEAHHIKLHGSLYHLSEKRKEIALALLDFATSSNLKIIALAGGLVVKLGHDSGLECLAEAFLDRHYLANGQLVPRGDETAELKSLEEVKKRLDSINKLGKIEARDGSILKYPIDTICVHSDSRVCREALALGSL